MSPPRVEVIRPRDGLGSIGGHPPFAAGNYERAPTVPLVDSATGRSSHGKWKSVGYGGHQWSRAAVVSANRGAGDYGSFTGRLVVLDAVQKQEALRVRVHRVSV